MESICHQALGRQLIKAGYAVYYRSIFDAVRDFLHNEAFDGHGPVMAKYLKSDLLILDDMGMKHLPKRSGKLLFEMITPRHEIKSTLMISSRPLEHWGNQIGGVPGATAVPTRFPHSAEILDVTGKSYRLRGGRAPGFMRLPLGSAPGHSTLRRNELFAEYFGD